MNHRQMVTLTLLMCLDNLVKVLQDIQDEELITVLFNYEKTVKKTKEAKKNS
ncbi:hypothetical protein ABXJ04_23485 (plasmid) [Escherichia coli]|uniref:hypothetical protein n=1 Tax=Escherichia coli TaxID=562 RepID=UPI0020250F47|nr:hypothetical protein [Escherichia coli]